MTTNQELTEQKAKEEGQKPAGWRIYWEIFSTMFRIGLCTFGGGYAMLPILQDEFIHKRHWITEKEMLDIISLSESLPGAIAVDAVIMVGYRIKKVKGGIVSVIGGVLPSVLVLTLVTFFYSSIQEGSIVWLFMRGIRAGVVGLMCSVVFSLFQTAVGDWFSGLLFGLGFVLAMFTHIQLILLVLFGGLAGYCYGRWRKAA